jgi:RNA polymerase sigma factor (sigma-70 family)
LPNLKTYTESQLLEGILNRDQQIFSYLYDSYAPTLYGVILKVVHEEQEATDVLQEVFVKIWKSIGKYDPQKGRLFTWMLNISRNTAIDVLRSKSYKLDQITRDLHNDIDLYAQHLSVKPLVDNLGLRKVVDHLSPEQKSIIDLAYYKGCTQEEIAKILDIPLGTVKTRTRNAINNLRLILKTV